MNCRREKRNFDEAHPLFAYRGMAAALIGAYKFQGRKSLAPFFASTLAQVLEQRWPNHALVPVPPRRASLRQRGWDPLECIVQILERRGFLVARLLERSGSVEQKRLSLEKRRRNAAASYHLRQSAAVPREVVLVDDVFTTGATVEACAKILKENGASFVAVLTLAMEL